MDDYKNIQQILIEIESIMKDDKSNIDDVKKSIICLVKIIRVLGLIS